MQTLKSFGAAIGIALTASIVPAVAAESVSGNVARSVARALELPYMKVYRGSACREKNVGDRWYIKCSPPGADVVGGLWAVAPGPALVAVNGKAKQHADNLGAVVDNDLKTIPLKSWADAYPGEIPNVGDVLNAYQ